MPCIDVETGQPMQRRCMPSVPKPKARCQIPNNFGQIPTILVKFPPFWSNFLNFGQIPTILVKFLPIILVKFPQFWSNFLNFGQIPTILVKFPLSTSDQDAKCTLAACQKLFSTAMCNTTNTTNMDKNYL